MAQQDCSGGRPTPAAGGESVLSRFSAIVARHAEAPAVADGDQVVSFAELHDRIVGLAYRLRNSGVGRGDRVGIVAQRGLGEIVAVWAAWWAGAVYVPLDPQLPRQRLAAMVTDAEVSTVVVPYGGDRDVPAGCRVVPLAGDGTVSGDAPAASPANRDSVFGIVDPVDPAYVIFTSGSTGSPKGVVVDHAGVVGLASNISSLVSNGSSDVGIRASLNASLAFDASVQQLVLMCAGHCVVPVADDTRRDPQAMVEFVRAVGIQVLDCTPTQLRGLIGAGLLDSADAPSVVLMGGEAVDQRLWDTLQAAENTRVFNVYGLTECTVDSLTAEVRVAGPTPCIGWPLPGVRAHVVDEAGAPVGEGVAGELWLGGVGVARGYLGDAELTSQRFLPDLLDPTSGHRLFRTGDLVRRRADGALEFLGRLDDQVKIRGYRIELGEVEQAMLAHPEVVEAAVVARRDETGYQRLVGYASDAPERPTDRDSAADTERVAEWQAVFEGAMRDPAATGPDPTFDLSGWISSYTRAQLPQPHVREWLDEAVAQIRALRPRRVLELGCGKGLVLFQVAPHCETYVGTDFSDEALAHVRDTVAAGAPTSAEFDLLQREARELADLPDGGFDLVILNGVTMYFPSIEYLRDVIRGSLRLLEPGGAMFIGDVRHLDLLTMFHVDVQLFRSADSLPFETFRGSVQQAVTDEQELLVHPRFFTELPDVDPRVTGVSVLPKHSRLDNEMTNYRYDVWLRTSPRESTAQPSWHDWAEVAGSLLALSDTLTRLGSEPWGVRGIPNHRLAREQALLADLARSPQDATIADVRRRLDQLPAPSVDPQRIRELAAGLGLRCETSWAAGHPDGAFDAVFARDPATLAGIDWPVPATQADQPLANNPLRRDRSTRLAASLRRHLAEVLPSYMLPADLVVLPSLPKTNGKIDRAALPEHVSREASPDSADQPRTPQAQALLQLVCEVLGRASVSLGDSFFIIGGDSLRALEVIGLIRERMSLTLSLPEFMGCSTLADLAKLLEYHGARTAARPTANEALA